MDLFKLQVDEEAGLQVVRDEQGVPFEALVDQVELLTDLSEFERFRCQRLLSKARRRPKTQITNIDHLSKEPFFSAGSQPEDDVQFCLEIYNKHHQSAEVVLEYPAADSGHSLLALACGGSTARRSNESGSEAVHRKVVRLTFELGSDEISSLINLCRILPKPLN